LNETQIIKGYELFFDGGMRKGIFSNGIEISGGGKITVPI
jgi:hypothetical protein